MARTGMTDGDFGKPIIAIANSFTQFVPGHVHLKDLGQLVAREIGAQAAWQKSSILSRWMTVLRWVTAVCSTRCRAGFDRGLRGVYGQRSLR